MLTYKIDTVLFLFFGFFAVPLQKVPLSSLALDEIVGITNEHSCVNIFFCLVALVLAVTDKEKSYQTALL